MDNKEYLVAVERASVQDEPIVKVLHNLIPTTQYHAPTRHRTETISSEDYRNVWNSPIPQLSYGWFLTQAIPPPGFDSLVSCLRDMLGAFISVDANGIETVNTNISSIVAGAGSRTSLNRFALDVLTSAILISPERSVQLLRQWLGDEPIRFTKYLVLSGFNLEPDTRLKFPGSKNIAIHSLPRDQRGLHAIGAPEMWVGHRGLSDFPPLGSPDIAGSAALVMHVTSGPAFYAKVSSQYATDLLLDNTPLNRATFGAYNFGVDSPFRCGLSLCCESPIAAVCTWGDISLQAKSFAPYSRTHSFQTMLYGGASQPQNPPILTEEKLSEALVLIKQIAENGLGERTKLALSRWIQSMNQGMLDGYIDLRIALESLYASDGGSEVTYRVASRCARHLATEINDREALFDQVRKFYSTASRVVHGTSIPDTPKYRRQLEFGRTVCRKAILKIIEENAGQDLEPHVLSFQ